MTRRESIAATGSASRASAPGSRPSRIGPKSRRGRCRSAPTGWSCPGPWGGGRSPIGIGYGVGMTRTAVWFGVIAFALVAWLAVFRTFGFDPTVPGSDAWNYLAAGERLNAGHPLYQLSPGDGAITLLPPYWTVPLLAPPPIAVLWRPLALVGEAAMVGWATAGLLTTLVTAGWLLARGGLVAAGIVALFAVPLAVQSLAGNANAFLFAALVL